MAESISTPAHLKNQEYIPSKICTQCGFIKPATSLYYHKRNDNKDGLMVCCKQCDSLQGKKYRQRNKGKIAERKKEYYQHHKCKITEYKKEYKARPEVRKRKNERERENYKNPTRKLCARIRRSLRHSIKNKNGSKSFEILGFTKESLMKHIEKQFKDGMSWEAFSRGEIHIDHKLPISKFNFKTTDDPDFKICWSLKNLQPMWAKENMSKNNKIEKPLQMSLSFSE